MGPLGALIRLHDVSGCCQRPSRPTMSTVAVSVPYWGHTAAVCLLVDGITCLRLPTRPTPLPPTHPLQTLSMILQQLEKNYLKTQQYQLGGRISYKTIATYVSSLLILLVWRGYIVAEENHSGFNISNWYFSKYLKDGFRKSSHIYIACILYVLLNFVFVHFVRNS